ncbi:hypothetical protein CVT26_012189 [Gymnopilus dilepis]|uniref:Uncharacterized protein n=1 Tax=Gymnopilus dilepis TaxID=231916 RepID=A0A409W9G3_9AGAR|nr:hypothetical protein CVT26_012189 [Gymnopilus dilepis]
MQASPTTTRWQSNLVVAITMRIIVLVLLILALAVYFVKKRRAGWTWRDCETGREDTRLLDEPDTVRDSEDQQSPQAAPSGTHNTSETIQGAGEP